MTSCATNSAVERMETEDRPTIKEGDKIERRRLVWSRELRLLVPVRALLEGQRHGERRVEVGEGQDANK